MANAPRTRYAHCDQPLPCAPGTSPFHIKGEFYRQTGEAMAHHDAKTGGAVMAALDRQGLREFVTRTFLSSALYDVLPIPRINMAIAEVRGFDIEDLTTRMGEAAVRTQMTGTYGRLLSALTPENFHQTFERVISQFYDFGPLTVEPLPSGAHVVRRGMPLCIAEWWSLVTIPFTAGPLTAKGARDVGASWRIEPRGVDRGVAVGDVVWDVHWTAPA